MNHSMITSEPDEELEAPRRVQRDRSDIRIERLPLRTLNK